MELTTEDDCLLDDPYGFIYITTNYSNGKRYIGQKKFDSKSRWKKYLGGGYYLGKAIKKYGKMFFKREIVAIAHSFDELNKLEDIWIHTLNAVNSGDYYNAMSGGGVINSLKKKNSIPLVCIDNNKRFASYAAVTDFFGINEQRIKRTLEKKHTIANYNKELPIFRKIKDVNDSLKYCCICGDIFDGSMVFCDECGLKIKKKDMPKYKYKYFSFCKTCNSMFVKNNGRQIYCNPRCYKTKRTNTNNKKRIKYNF